MQITVTFFGPLAEQTGEETVRFDLPRVATFGDLLDDIGDRFGNLFHERIWDTKAGVFRAGILVVGAGRDLDSRDVPLLDGEEIQVHLTDPLLPDTDGDTLSDFLEVKVHLTDPKKVDTDGDLLNDNDELELYFTDPLLPDTDDDGLDDRAEIIDHKTSPLLNDTDLDNLTDYDEVITYTTNPLINDTDGDGLDDWLEIFFYFTKPKEMDTDKGGMDDGSEVKLGRDPLDPSDDVELPANIITHPTEIRFTSTPTNKTKMENRFFDVSGRVTDENGTGLVGILVEIYMNKTLAEPGSLVGNGSTEANGIFVVKCELLRGLKTGENYLRARASSKVCDG